MFHIFFIILAVGILPSKAAKQNLTVLMVLNDPYLMYKDYDGQVGGEYEGFSVDLLKLLEEELGVPMSIQVIDTYGVYQESSEKWTGMVGELSDGSADMAIADLTVTESREEAIDFSVPFMSGGITILSKKRVSTEQYFSFLDPFTLEVWIIITVSYLTLGIAYIVLNIIKKKNEKCEASKISVLSLPILKITTIVFTILMACIYTASLSAFLTTEPVEKPVDSVDDLFRQKTIKFGTVLGGSTMAFFKASDISYFQHAWRFMEKNNNLNVKNNKEGVERVLRDNGDYAFLMESTTAKYVTERICDLKTVGGLINDFHYSIGLPLNSEYRKPINQAILKLKSSGIIKKLEKKWWQQKRGGGACMVWIPQGSVRLELMSLAGVLWILLAGFIISVLAILLEVFLLYLG